MSTEENQPPRPEGRGEERDFREAVAQWRFAVRTEVKRVSSLPTAMFDATDPMLEMRLAETTEAMLAQLQMPAPHLADTPEETELRLESIELDDMRRLPGQIGSRPEAHVDLLSELASEYLGVLADSCCMQLGEAQQRAVEQICVDFGVTAENLEEMIGDLHRLSTDAHGHVSRGRPQEAQQRDVESIVEQVADALRARMTSDAGRGDPQP